ncbi:MAG: DUF3332 family protein [Planctomycetes bacterium]|nr:DUF3332 family protein [Planctomycetota bacterium]
MRKLALVVVAAVFLGATVGCGGPFTVSRSVNDWYNQKYGETPWLYGNMVSSAVYGLAMGLSWTADMLVVNTYHFWVKDAQPIGDGKGTTFEHKNPTSGKKR